jgi:hypothetical protein
LIVKNSKSLKIIEKKLQILEGMLLEFFLPGQVDVVCRLLFFVLNIEVDPDGKLVDQ